MKILQISTYDIRGGAGRAAYRLHRGLVQMGQASQMLVKRKDTTDPSVFAATPQDLVEHFEENFFLSRVIQDHYINSNRTDVSTAYFSLPYPGYDLSTLPLVQTADILNLHWVAHHYLSLVSLQKLFALRKPVVWTLHDQWPFTGGCHYTGNCERYRYDCVACPQLEDDPFNLPAAILKDKLDLFRGANLTIVSPSQWLAAGARESKLFGDLRIEVIPYSLETDVFSPLPKDVAKEKIGLTAETVTLLFGAASANMRRKGFRQLMDAIHGCLEDKRFQELVDTDEIRLLCFGDSNKELDAVGIPTLFFGFLKSEEEIRDVYVSADLFVLPSLEDNLPNTMLEAMSCGTPVVAFDVGGISDAVMGGVTGQLAPAGDTNQLGKAILSLVFDPNRREKMEQNCRAVALERFSLPVQARRYVELYRELHQEHKASNQVVPGGPIWDLDHTRGPVNGVAEEPLAVHFETGVGPHFHNIYDQVLLRVLKEYAPAREKAFQGVRKQLSRLTFENTDLNRQLKQLHNSWSWKITAPLRSAPFRKAAEILKRLKA